MSERDRRYARILFEGNREQPALSELIADAQDSIVALMHIQTIWDEDSKTQKSAQPLLAAGVIELWLGHLRPTRIPLHLLEPHCTDVGSDEP
ncbi:hypothetical protein DL96DRAFT_1822527 [Flagelloscypha sp. PMI_526]|nr:hypothetical protein DL96DRAFT_1822527 [Flagelloscypha sp. PMI_526]